MYRDILEFFFWPDIVQELGEEVARRCWFMQDGAPAHTATASRELVQGMFPDHVVGRYLAIEWPPRSPDLTPCDYFLWGFIKDRVYRHELGPVNSLVDLMQRIVTEFQWIRENAMQQVREAVEAFHDRLEQCVDIEGKQLGLKHL